MTTNKKLRTDLLNHLKVTPQRLSQIAQKVKNELGPMLTEEAIYVIAHRNGFDITKYLEHSVVNKIRGLLQNTRKEIINKPKQLKTSTKQVLIKLRSDSSIIKFASNLSTSLAEDALKMAALYPQYYILENSIRITLKSILENKYGKNWWQTKAPKAVRDDVMKRKDKESKQPWHGKRGQHELFYSNFGDLKKIIQLNWNDFKYFFPNQAWIAQRLDELEHPRNVLAHHNPVSKNDQKRIDLYLSDWIALLKSNS